MDTLFPFFSRSSEILVICLPRARRTIAILKKYTLDPSIKLIQKDAKKNVSLQRHASNSNLSVKRSATTLVEQQPIKLSKTPLLLPPKYIILAKLE